IDILRLAEKLLLAEPGPRVAPHLDPAVGAYPGTFPGDRATQGVREAAPEPRSWRVCKQPRHVEDRHGLPAAPSGSAPREMRGRRPTAAVPRIGGPDRLDGVLCRSVC